MNGEENLSIALDNGNFDLLYFFDPLAVPCGFEDVVFRQARSPRNQRS